MLSLQESAYYDWPVFLVSFTIFFANCSAVRITCRAISRNFDFYCFGTFGNEMNISSIKTQLAQFSRLHPSFASFSKSCSKKFLGTFPLHFASNSWFSEEVSKTFCDNFAKTFLAFAMMFRFNSFSKKSGSSRLVTFAKLHCASVINFGKQVLISQASAIFFRSVVFRFFPEISIIRDFVRALSLCCKKFFHMAFSACAHGSKIQNGTTTCLNYFISSFWMRSSLLLSEPMQKAWFGSDCWFRTKIL